MASFTTSYLPTDEEEERRRQIEEITSGFGREFAAGMEAGGLDVGAGDPEPVDPRAGLPAPQAFGTSRERAAPEIADPWGEGAPEPRVAAAPARPDAPVRPASPMSPVQTARAPEPGQAPSPYDDELAGLRSQLSAAADPSERRRRIVAGVLMGMQQRTPEQIRSALGPSPRDRQAAIMQRISQLRGEQEAQRAATIQRALEMRRGDELAQQRQANADRDFALRQQTADDMTAYRRAALDQRTAQYERSQGFREEQADLNRAAAETRARIIAGQRIGPGGTIRQPGGQGSGVDVGQFTDAPIIQAMVDNRPEIQEMAQRLAQEQRANGQDADESAIAWDIASNQFRAMSRKNQDMVRRQYAAPESTGMEARSEQRATEQRANRVRQYGQDVQARTEWDRSVRAAVQAMQGASDTDIRMAQQWLQGGMRQAVTELSPGARQLAQRLARLQNVLLRERSGAAVTDQEFARLRAELGANWYQSPESMRAALQEMGGSSQEMARILAATYGPEVVEAYQRNLQAAGGGQPSEQSGSRPVQVGDVVTLGGVRRRVTTQAEADAINRARGGQR